MNILVDSTLPYLSSAFPNPPFNVSTYASHEALHAMLPFNEALVCRSTLKVDEALLEHSTLQCVATASSGTDHLDRAFLEANKIQVFDAKGSNAHAVVDYVTATLVWCEQNLPRFGKKAGVIGIGEVGSRVFKRLRALHYDVIAYDPYHLNTSLHDLVDCDVICLHANLHQNAPYPSLNLMNADFLTQLKPGVVLINASRGGIVNEADLLTCRDLVYCTDVYVNEPNINPAIIEFSTLCTPHIAGHTIEAKRNAMNQLSAQFYHYLGIFPRQERTSMAVELCFDGFERCILTHYNPYEETQALKTDLNKKQAFIRLRNAHRDRHDY